MADNVVANPGALGDTFAADDIGGVYYPRTKIAMGVDGTASGDMASGAGAVDAMVPRVTLASDDPAVAKLGTIDTDTGAIVTAVQIMDDWDESDRAKVNPIAGQAGIAAGSGAVDVLTPRVILATDDPAVTLLGTIDTDTGKIVTAVELIDNAIDGTEMQVDVVAALPAGDNNIGNVDIVGGTVTTVSAVTAITNELPAGTQLLGKVGIDQTTPGTTNAVYLTAGTNAIGKLAANTGVDIGDVDVLSMPTGATATAVQGTVASGAAAANSPLLSGARASTTEPTAVDTGDAVALASDVNGRLIVRNHANQENAVSAISAVVVNDTVTTILAAQGGGVKVFVTDIMVTCGHATVGTYVTIQDEDDNAIWKGYAAALGGGFAVKLDPPIEVAANKIIELKCTTTGSSIVACVNGYTGA